MPLVICVSLRSLVILLKNTAIRRISISSSSLLPRPVSLGTWNDLTRPRLPCRSLLQPSALGRPAGRSGSMSIPAGVCSSYPGSLPADETAGERPRLRAGRSPSTARPRQHPSATDVGPRGLRSLTRCCGAQGRSARLVARSDLNVLFWQLTICLRYFLSVD